MNDFLQAGVLIPIKLKPFFSSGCLSSDSTVYRPTYTTVSVVIPDIPVMQKVMTF